MGESAQPQAVAAPKAPATVDGAMVDVAIIGAGISGIGMAAHLQMECPDRTFAILERRDTIGGTWDLFRYPGVRSDSDMYTLGFGFEPWREKEAIASGDAILAYLNRIAGERGIATHIRFGRKVVRADWDSKTALWTLTAEGPDGTVETLVARWLHLGAGYYDQDKAHDPEIPGLDSFGGAVIHPQFWPTGFDHAGKRIVVIGSGATAVTVVPAMARAAAHVTMLQRTPSWYIVQPTRDVIANALRRVLPLQWAYAVTRYKNVRLQDLFFRQSRAKPAKMAAWLTGNLKKVLGNRYREADFTPPYNPWEQRLCLVPDGDLFDAITAGKASIVTDRIDHVDKTGVQLQSGRRLDADVIVPATGLRLSMAGKIAIHVDGERVNFAERFYYKSCMFSNVPNLSVLFGYLNASWTLRVDLIDAYLCRVLNTMRDRDADIAIPVLADARVLVEDDVYDYSSGYIQRSRAGMPKSATDMRWRLSQDYLADRKWMPRDPVEDGALQLSMAPRKGTIEAQAQPCARPPLR